MADSSKTTKRARAAAEQQQVAATKDDGTRWSVVRGGVPVYPGAGVPREQAKHLALGLVEPAELQLVSGFPWISVRAYV